ncbi:MAG: hypothetical protein ACNA7M_06840 [Roseovarius sp.]
MTARLGTALAILTMAVANLAAAEPPKLSLPLDHSLWQTALPYDPAGLFTAGFFIAVPELEWSAPVPPEPSPRSRISRSSFMAMSFTPNRATACLTAQGLESEIFTHAITLDAPQAQHSRTFGHKAPEGAGCRARIAAISA